MTDITVNSRKLSCFAPNEYHQIKNTQANFIFDLSYLSLLEVNGDKASEFLQGQLTCDVRIVAPLQMIQGLQCNLKGRILSTLDVINWQGYKLILPDDLIESTQISLNKTAQLSRVSLQKNKALKIFGFYLQNKDGLTPPGHYFAKNLYEQHQSELYCAYYLGNGFYIYIVKPEFEAYFVDSFKKVQCYLGSFVWHHLRLEAGRIDIYPESRGLFLPHRLGFHQTNFISFNKGCYKGQEIIARTHYKATIKHQLNIVEMEMESPPYSGQKLLNDKRLEIGELIDYSPLNNNRYLIAASMLKEDSRLGSVDN